MDMNNVVKKVLRNSKNIKEDHALKEELKSSVAGWNNKKERQYEQATFDSCKVEREIENNFGK